jgi:hypothetical protein
VTRLDGGIKDLDALVNADPVKLDALLLLLLLLLLLQIREAVEKLADLSFDLVVMLIGDMAIPFDLVILETLMLLLTRLALIWSYLT